MPFTNCSIYPDLKQSSLHHRKYYLLSFFFFTARTATPLCQNPLAGLWYNCCHFSYQRREEQLKWALPAGVTLRDGRREVEVDKSLRFRANLGDSDTWGGLDAPVWRKILQSGKRPPGTTQNRLEQLQIQLSLGRNSQHRDKRVDRVVSPRIPQGLLQRRRREKTEKLWGTWS